MASHAPLLPVSEVPQNLAVLAGRKNYLWHETPAMQESAATMRDLCHSVVQALYENCSHAPVLREHHAVTTDAVYTLLKEGEQSLTGKRKPDEVGRNVRNRLEVILKKNGAVTLEKDHPYASEPGVAIRKTVKARHPLTGLVTEKAEHMLKTKPGFEEAVQALKDHDCLRRLAEEQLTEMLKPGEQTVMSLPRNLLSILDGQGEEDDKRTLLVEAIGEFCNRRNDRLTQELQEVGSRFLSPPVPGMADEDYLISVIERILVEADIPRMAYELRSLMMASLLPLAYAPPKLVLSGGNTFTPERFLRYITEQEWPRILEKSRTAAPPELEIAKLAVASRYNPLDEVHKTISSLERAK